MAITIDDILTGGKGPAITAGIPPIDGSMQGAPATVPGSGSGELATGATDIKGNPAGKVTVPASVAPEIHGAPNAGQTVAKPRPEIIPPELPRANSLPKIGEKINQSESVKRVTDINPIPEKEKNEKPKKLSYVELFQQMSPYTPPSEEDLERERKKRKREAIFSAIGDGISALSNLFFTTHYAPNAYDPSKGMAAATKKRFDQLKRERDDNAREYMNGYIRAMQMDADAARDERNWSHTIEREKITDKWRQDAEDRKRSKEEFDAQKRGLDLQYLQGKIDRNNYLKEQERLEKEYMEKHGMKMPTTPKPSSGRGSGGGKSGGGHQKTSVWTAYNPKTGETMHINATSAAHAWSQVRDGFTIRQAPSTTTTESTSGNGINKKTTHRTSTKNANDNLEGPGKKKKNRLGL